MSFISGNNMGGKEVKYYDNPNYNPNNEGKSKIDAALKRAAESAAWAENANEQYATDSIDYDYVIEAEGEAAYDAKRLSQQQDSTISYFRNKERERLNKDYPNAGAKQNNPNFNRPVSFEDKLSRVAPSYDDWLDSQVDKSNIRYQFDDMYGGDSDPFEFNDPLPVNENSVKRKAGGGPLPKTRAGVNQDLQAIKARTRDASMEFRGMVFDFINEFEADIQDDMVYQSIDVDAYGGRSPRRPSGFQYIQNKYFPDTASKEKARNIILKMIDDSGYNKMPTNTLEGVAEELVTIKNPELREFGYGASRLNNDVKSNKKTLANLQKGVTEFSNWKAKKGVPRIVKLLTKYT